MENTQNVNKKLNNTIVQPGNSLPYNSINQKQPDKIPQSALNSRNWRNKSIDNTPDMDRNYAY